MRGSPIATPWPSVAAVRLSSSVSSMSPARASTPVAPACSSQPRQPPSPWPPCSSVARARSAGAPSEAASAGEHIGASRSANSGTASIPGHCPAPRTTIASTSSAEKSGRSSAEVRIRRTMPPSAASSAARRGSSQRIAKVEGRRSESAAAGACCAPSSASACVATASSASPAAVSLSPVACRRNRAWPPCASSCWIWRLTAPCVRHKCSAARLTLPSRAAATKAW